MTTTFTVTGSELNDTVSWVVRATPTKPTAPVLSGLVLDATDDGHLSIFGYDYETSMRATIDATVDTPGRALVSGRLLAAVAKTLNRDGLNVTIEVDAARAVVKAGKSEWSLPVLPVEDYPQLPDLGEPVGTVDAAALRRAAGRALTAVGKEHTLPQLTGARIESDGGRMTIICTDRFRLTAVELDWQRKDDEPLALLVPGGLLDDAARGVQSGTVTLSAGDGGFGLATDDRSITGRLIAAEFPRWRSLVPAPSDTFAELDADGFLALIGQAEALAPDSTRALRFEFSGGEVAVSVSGDDRRANAVGPADLSGEPFTLSMNGGYVRDAVSAAGADGVRLHYGGGDRKPVLIVPVGDDTVRTIVMPVRGQG